MIIHILKLIRSRMGGSGWILAELLVVFVVICDQLLLDDG